ncbi:hypothetical protein OG21DRAFT_1488115 [Imleria badia]|nr:hypothetical protein OG21DRAFT_1488115 [Imleria badia]
MAMIHALGPDYYHFTSSLALLTDLDKDKVKAAFQTEEINHRPRPDGSSPVPSNSVLSATSGSYKCDPLDVKTPPDPICEPCLAGKMHANPFPSSQSRILSSLSTPMSIRFRFVMPIKHKSDVLGSFKTFKVIAETQSERRINALRDDKGGEYI